MSLRMLFATLLTANFFVVAEQSTARPQESSRQAGANSPRPTAIPIDEIVHGSKMSAEEIRLKKRSFAPVVLKQAGVPSIASDQERHLIIQLERGRGDETIKRLATAGIDVLEYIPVSAVSARVPPGVDPLAIQGVRWAGRLQPADKLSSAIDSRPGLQRLVVDVHPGLDLTEIAGNLAGASPATRVLEKLEPRSLLVETDQAGATAISRLDGVSYLFPAAKELSAKSHRCPGPMTSAGPVAFYSLRGEGWDGQGPNATSLTYRIDASLVGTPNILPANQRSEIVRGISAWSQHAQISFSETTAPNLNRCLEVFWGSDGLQNFDGADGTLAYCYFPSPPNRESVAGNLHFDPDEAWQIGQGAGIDLFSVALHEAGHGIGLDHSDVNSAVMYPYYNFTTGPQQDDITAIRALYASTGGAGGGGGGAGNDSFEPDNNLAQAKSIQPGTMQSRSIEPVGDVDYASFELTSQSDVVVSTSGTTGDTRLFLYDASGTQIALNDDSGGSFFSKIERSSLTAGVYYAAVDEYGNNGTIPSYQLSVSAATLASVGDAFESDNQPEQARLVSGGQRQVRSISPAGDLDCAYFTLSQPSEVVLETSGASGDTRMWLSSASVSTLEFNDDGGDGLFSRIDRLEKDGDELPAGTYYVLLNEYSNAREIPSYNLDLTVFPLAGTGGDDAYEPNNVIGDYYAPGFNWERTLLSGIQGPGVQRDDDWYEIDVWPPGYERVVVESYFSSDEGDIDLALYDYRGRLLAVSQESTRDYEAISIRVPRAGYYYLRVYYENAGNSYDLYWDDLERNAPGIDTVPPVVQWISPPNGKTLKKLALFSGRAKDSTKVETVFYRIGSSLPQEAYYSTQKKKWFFLVDPFNTASGVVPVSVYAVDSLGNTSAELTRFYTIP